MLYMCILQIYKNTFQDMEMMLQPFLLDLHDMHRNELLVLEPEHDNAAKRHAAYRMFVYWWQGRLGVGNRRVIPSCVVLRVQKLNGY